MHDVLLHYLEVNFAEIAEQLAYARAREPGREDRMVAAERLRGLIRRLRREAMEIGAASHEPRATAAQLIAGVDGELSAEERAVLERFFGLFVRSMERTQAASYTMTQPEAAPAPPEVQARAAEAEVGTATEEATTPAPQEAAPGRAEIEAPIEESAVVPAPPEETTAPEQPVPVAIAEELVAEELVGEELLAEELGAAEAVAEEAAIQAPPRPEPLEHEPPAATPPSVEATPPEFEEAPEIEEAQPPALVAPTSVEAAPPSRLVAEQMSSPLQTILLAAAQQALDFLQVDASQVFTLDEQRRFVLRAGVPTESLAAPEGSGPITSTLLRRALDYNEVYAIEDLTEESLTSDEVAWVEAGYRGFAAIALSPPLERPVGVLALLRRTPWRLDRRDAVRLEDLAVEAVAALRSHSLAIKVEEVAVLQERLNLAREIHDGLASDLAAVVALFKYYEQRRQRDPEDAAQLLPQIQSMTEEILAGARNILQSLRPKTIRSEGLLASVLKAVDQFGRVNLIETNVSIRGEEAVLSAEQKEVIFQVLRESLSNIRKHAQARNVWVVLDLTSTPWVMTVRDDGRGFDVRRVAEDPKKVRSYGLVGMRERAELVGGSLEIVSRSVEGTVVTLFGPPERTG